MYNGEKWINNKPMGFFISWYKRRMLILMLYVLIAFWWRRWQRQFVGTFTVFLSEPRLTSWSPTVRQIFQLSRLSLASAQIMSFTPLSLQRAILILQPRKHERWREENNESTVGIWQPSPCHPFTYLWLKYAPIFLPPVSFSFPLLSGLFWILLVGVGGK